MPWCSWCKILEPIWKELPRRFSTKDLVRVARIDCTHSSDICKENKITIYPTLILFKKGKRLEEYLGQNDIKHFQKYLKLHVKYLHSDEL